MESIKELRDYIEDHNNRYTVDYDKVLDKLDGLQEAQTIQVFEIINRLDLVETYAQAYVPDISFLRKLVRHTLDSVFKLEALIQPDEEIENEPAETNGDGDL